MPEMVNGCGARRRTILCRCIRIRMGGKDVLTRRRTRAAAELCGALEEMHDLGLSLGEGGLGGGGGLGLGLNVGVGVVRWALVFCRAP